MSQTIERVAAVRRAGWARIRRAAAPVCVAVAIAGVAILGAHPEAAGAAELGAMGPAEIALLAQRLQDLGCFAGPVTGTPGPDLKAALARCPDPSPRLTIETGRPTTPLRRIAVDASCRLGATISYDKTVRIWSLPDGAIRRVVRLPFGEGDELDGLAMSPDGRWIATGGWDAREFRNAIALFDTETGLTVRRIGQYANQVGSLAFSPDGTRLAVALGDEGIRVLEVPDGRVVASDGDFAESTNAMAYGPDGALYVASYDGTIRRYGPDGTRTHKAATTSGRNPFTVAVSRDGQRLAIGFADARRIELFDAATLRNLGSSASERWADDNISRVAWTADGHVVAGGDTGRPQSPLHVFDGTGRHEKDLSLPAQYVLDLQPCGDGTIVSAVEPPLSLVHADGSFTVLARGDAADMRFKAGPGFKVSADGTRVLFHLGFGAKGPAILLDVAAGTATPAPADETGLLAPTTDTLIVDRDSGEVSPGLPAAAVPDDAENSARTLAIRPDRQGFVLGSWSRLRVFDGHGKRRWVGRSAMPVGGVQLAGDGGLVLVAYLDGTIRWFRWSDGRELLAAFVHRGDLRTVLWTPSGFHATSAGAEGLFGWQFNRDWTSPAEFIPAADLGSRLRRPDVIRRILTLRDETLAVRAADAARDRPL